MKRLRAVWRIFLAMPIKEKVTAGVLIVLFVFSMGKFFVLQWSTPDVEARIGFFTEGFVGHVRIINPLYVEFNDSDRDVSSLVFSGLLKYDPKEKNFVPDLAESWERNSSGLVYTIKLRKDVTWHDGTPFTAKDVVFTLQDVVQDPGFKNPIARQAFANVKVEAPDDFSVIITLPRSNSYFITNLTTGILPQHLLGSAPIAELEKESFNHAPIGTGPYRVTDFKPHTDGDLVDLELYDKYYGKKPLVKRLRLYSFPNEEELLKYTDGTLQSIVKLSETSGAQIAAQNPEKYTSTTYTLNQFTGIFVNTQDVFLQDKRVRQALSYSLDKSKLLGDSEQRVDMLDLFDHGTEERFALNGAKATELFTAAGYTLDETTKLLKNEKGETLHITLLVHSKISEQISNAVAGQWKTLGVEVEVKRAEGEELMNLINERRYGALLIKQNLGYNRDVYPLFHSSQVGGEPGKPSGLNFGNFRSFRTDGLTEALRKEQNPTDKARLIKELMEVLVDEVPIIFISTPKYAYVLDTRVPSLPEALYDYHSDRHSVLPYLTIPQFN